MQSDHSCPRCQQTLSEERRMARPVVCDSCGLVLSAQERKAGAQLERRFMIVAISLSVVLVGAFMQVVSWGGYSIEAIPLEVGQLLHTNQAPQLERLVKIAFELHKYDLAETAYSGLAQINHADFLRLGKFEMSRGKYPEAADAFRRYFAEHNEDLEGHYLYARALSETGQIDEARKHYEYVLNAKPGIRQVTVLHNYVKALTLAGRFQEARRVIEEARTLDKTATAFMDTEYKLIIERLHSKT